MRTGAGILPSVILSVWPEGSRANADAVAIDVPWADFAAWIATPLDTDDKHAQGFSPLAAIGPGEGGRINAGPASFVCVEWDRTATPVVFAYAVAALSGTACVIYTTASATPAEPRFRAVVAVDRPIVSSAEYRSVVDHVTNVVGTPCAPESREWTRLWYRPIRGCSVRVFEGAPWSVDLATERHPHVDPPPRPAPDLSGFTDTAMLAQAWAALVRSAPEGMYRAALVCRDHGVPEDVATALVTAYATASEWTFDPDDPAERTANAYAYAQGEPGAALVEPAAAAVSVAAAAISVGHWPANDQGNASRLLANFGADLRSATGLGWLRWGGYRWAPVPAPWAEAEACAEATRVEGGKVGGDPGKAIEAWGRKSGDAGRLRAAIEVASHRPGIELEASTLDADPWVLATPSGIIDLRTGTLRAATRDDLVTRATSVPYDSAATCPRFIRFLHEAMDGDADLCAYLVRWGGYCLTGSTAEQALGLWHGGGANGKSTLINAWAAVFGEYAGTVAPDVLLATQGSSHPTGLMDLRGRRLVTSVETSEGRRWNESLVKQLTGSDRVKARAMRMDFVEFVPTHKLVLATNTLPRVIENGDSFWRRVHLVPWDVSFRGREDKTLPDALAAEAPGILALLVRGCAEWTARGLAPPVKVLRANEDYRARQDVIGTWIEDALIKDPTGFVSGAELHRAYAFWAREAQEHVLPRSAFVRILGERRALGTWAVRGGSTGLLGHRLRA
jgi:P4 family phage/plasmid primase-like protien